MKAKRVRPLLVAILLAIVAVVSAGAWLPAWQRRSWEFPLMRAVADADRIRVRTGGTCHRHPPSERTLCEERDTAKGREFVANSKINAQESGWKAVCLCCGGPSIEFYKGEELVVTLGCHEGRFRWVEGWQGDAVLTPGSAKYV